MQIIENSELQELADGLDNSDLVGGADFTVGFDDCDEFDAVGEWIDGFKHGLKVAQAANLSIEEGQGEDVYLVTYSEYGNDDGNALFIGTFESVRNRLLSIAGKQSS